MKIRVSKPDPVQYISQPPPAQMKQRTLSVRVFHSSVMNQLFLNTGEVNTGILSVYVMLTLKKANGGSG